MDRNFKLQTKLRITAAAKPIWLNRQFIFGDKLSGWRKKKKKEGGGGKFIPCIYEVNKAEGRCRGLVCVS